MNFKKAVLLCALCLMLASCTSSNNGGGNQGGGGSNSGGNQGGNEQPITYNASVKYMFNGFEVSTSSFSIKGDDINETNLKNKFQIPNEYDYASTRLNDCLESDFNYSAHTVTYTLKLKAVYDGYVILKSDKDYLDNQILPADILSVHYQTSAVTVNNYAGQPVTFNMTDIKEIKFKNSKEISGVIENSHAYNKDSYTKLTNLTKVDLSEMQWVKSIKNNFLSYLPNLTDVLIGNAFKNVKTVGANFLSGCPLKTLNVDFASAESVGSDFLFNSFNSITSNATVKFGKLSAGTLYASFAYQKEMPAGKALNLYLGDTIPSTNWFILNGMAETLYVPSFVTNYKGENEQNRTNGTYNFYSNYKSNLDILFDGWSNQYLTINVYNQ